LAFDWDHPLPVIRASFREVLQMIDTCKLARRMCAFGAAALSWLAAGQARGQATPTDTDAELAREARLPRILALALERNPELDEARARSSAARERAPAAGRLPDPEFKYELWGGPLLRPYALDEAQMHMFGLRQMIPAPGTRGAEERALAEVAQVAEQMGRAREQDIAARVRRAYAEYYRADREYRIHLEHAALAEQIIEFARAAYRAGRGNQQDVLRSALVLSRLHTDVALVERDRRSARALLNSLMARAVDAPLGPPAALDGSRAVPKAQELEKKVGARPEVVAAEHAARSRDQEVEAARASGRWPSFMVGVDYQYMPLMDEPHGYGLMFTMSLPWLNPRYGEEVRAAEANRKAEQSAVDSIRNAARYELHEAVSRAEAAHQSLTLLEQQVLPQARQSFEAAQAAYRGGQGDSLALLDTLRSLLEVRIERERALAAWSAAMADVDRAAGSPALPRATKAGK
jgi:outer membrane protein, heavy metal efflux system